MKLPKSSLMLLLATGQFVFDIFSAGLSSPAGMMMSGTHTVRDDIILFSIDSYHIYIELVTKAKHHVEFAQY